MNNAEKADVAARVLASTRYPGRPSFQIAFAIGWAEHAIWAVENGWTPPRDETEEPTEVPLGS